MELTVAPDLKCAWAKQFFFMMKLSPGLVFIQKLSIRNPFLTCKWKRKFNAEECTRYSMGSAGTKRPETEGKRSQTATMVSKHLFERHCVCAAGCECGFMCVMLWRWIVYVCLCHVLVVCIFSYICDGLDTTRFKQPLRVHINQLVGECNYF